MFGGVVVGLRSSSQGYGASDGIRQKFTGYERDNETGLDFAQARYNCSTQGRFTSPDSLMGSIGNPQSLNRYAYVNNNPMNFTDPTGHMPSGGAAASIHDGEGGGGSRWDDPTSPQAVLDAAGIVSSDRIVSTQQNFNAPEEAPVSTYYSDLYGPSGNAGVVAEADVPQNSQEDFEASAEYHKLLVGYTNSLLKAMPGSSVQWNADTGKIQYIDFPGTYEETIAALERAAYFTGVTNFAWNPVGHAGGKEFRDPSSVACELSFHFAVLYPQYQLVDKGRTINGNPALSPERLPGPTRAVDVHIDRASPLHPGSLSTHAKDFWRDLERKFGFR